MLKKVQIIFLGLGMLICMLPFLGMVFHPTEETTDNRKQAEYPSLTTKEGKLNTDYPSQLEKWFDDHFFLRNEMIYADSMIQGKIFGTSAVENVIYGTDGWLYYTSTLGDYLGTERMTEREVSMLSHNLSLICNWAEAKGITPVLAVPPNKNTLYGEHMPYYDSLKVDPAHTLEQLPSVCEEIGLPYADLYGVFRDQEEVLYLKRDSHWNNKGAVLACDAILDKTGAAYTSFADAEVTRSKDSVGDLDQMLYTFYGEPEMNYHYAVPQTFTYETQTKSVEDAWIATTCEGKKGTLLMFRDSFGNTLLEQMAEQFGRAVFTKESPYRLQKVVREQQPDTLIIEKVERNLKDFITEPPIVDAAEFGPPPSVEDITLCDKRKTDPKDFETELSTSPYDPDLYRLSGRIPEDMAEGMVYTDTEICLKINGKLYSAYQTRENGFCLYLNRQQFSEAAMEVQVILINRNENILVGELTVDPE